MENERPNVWVWILWIVIRGNYAIWLEHFVYWGKSNLGVTENSLMSLGGQKENVSNKVNSPPIRDFMNERYQDIQFKPFKIWLSKSTVQAQSRIIKTESIPVSTRAEI